MASGYSIRIDAFVPVDPSNVDDQIATGQAVKAALEGDLSALIPRLQDVQVGQKFVNRRTAPAAPTTAEPPAQEPVPEAAE